MWQSTQSDVCLTTEVNLNCKYRHLLSECWHNIKDHTRDFASFSPVCTIHVYFTLLWTTSFYFRSIWKSLWDLTELGNPSEQAVSFSFCQVYVIITYRCSCEQELIWKHFLSGAFKNTLTSDIWWLCAKTNYKITLIFSQYQWLFLYWLEWFVFDLTTERLAAVSQTWKLKIALKSDDNKTFVEFCVCMRW